MLPPKLILCPIDFSEYSHTALNVAIDFASCFGAELCLAHVVPAIPKLPSAETIFREREYEEELHKDAQRQLDELARKIANRGVRSRVVLGTANDVSMELLNIAEHNNVDLVVIATHGMTGWHKLAFGSVAEKVVRLATCPVLVLRAQVASESAGSKKADSVAAAR